MPRRPRIDLAGYHHIINRGVNRSTIFQDEKDYEIFLKILCKASTAYRVVVHDYCLMDNHFHLLIETELENLSLFMKHINSNYAIYFNRKSSRSGHFWQGRFYSRYVSDEMYYYTLIRYIEQNPIEAKIVSKIGEYPYTLAATIINHNEVIPCAQHSRLIEELHDENIQEIIGVKLSSEEREILEKIQKQKTITVEGKAKAAYHHTLKKHFKNSKLKEKRDSAIIKALNDGYTQAEIAKHLNLSRSLISKIVKSAFSTPDP